jgi:hypothetical protein
MSVFDEISKIGKVKLASDMGEKFVATVNKIERDVTKGQIQGQPVLKFTLETESGEKFTTTYRIPKAMTGKGQLDMLQEHALKLGVEIKDMVGKKFVWQAKPLAGGVQGNARHYPVKLVK